MSAEKITVRYAESGASRIPKDEQKEGLYYFELRSHDEGMGYNIEDHVRVNNIGCLVADHDILENGHTFIGPNRFKDASEVFQNYEMVNDASLL